MRVCFIASEVEPFAKTGGLADVTAALPKALQNLGHDVRIVMPLYRQVDRTRYALARTSLRVLVIVGAQTFTGRIWKGLLPGRSSHRVVVYFIECAAFFDRDGLYQTHGVDHPDNLARFSFFSQAALRLLPALKWQPHVVHCHDWQTALACAHLKFGSMGREPFFSSIGTVFTVHNLAYQGLFPKEQWALTQLPWSAFAIQGLEFYDQISCLKGGLISAGRLNTVSPTYAGEIQTPAFGCGLEGVLIERRRDLVGILNGIDQAEWDPRTDSSLAACYSDARLEGKAVCKATLQQRQRLPRRAQLVIGMIQRLAEQKGIDIFLEALRTLATLPVQIVLLGAGDPAYQTRLERAAASLPDRLAVNFTFDNALAHQIEAGADAFLMPSRFEPCGLNQMYSMRFGTVPIVKRVGGLADTVVDATPSSIGAKTATGFVFEPHTSQALVDAVRRAVAAFEHPTLWRSLMRAGMRQDFSWDRSAREYLRLYERTLPKSARMETPASLKRESLRSAARVLALRKLTTRTVGRSGHGKNGFGASRAKRTPLQRQT